MNDQLSMNRASDVGKSLDIKWRAPFSLQGRRYRHLTPSYIYNRVRHALYRRRRPTMPDLTESSIALLSDLLREHDVGAEWGAGNSTAWLASLTAKITSFENGPDYVHVVRDNLARQRIQNADLRYVAFKYGPEGVMHDSEWVRSAAAFDDNSLDYALVDSAPRGCLCNILTTKIRVGGLLILDNANWYLPPPATLRPKPAASVEVALGFPGSREPQSMCWPQFIAKSQSWRHLWTSNGVTATLIMVRAT